MSNGKASTAGKTAPISAGAPVKPVAAPTHTPPLFRPIDWLTFGVTTLCVWVGYFLTLAPDLTLEDSGELAVASYYAGIPHPPGYPVWTIYTWIWTVLLPIKNIAWRVALGEATAGAVACGLLGFLVSRGSSMMIEGIAELKNIDRRWENAICVVSGFVAGMLLGFNGYMWSQSVIVEVYSFSVLSLMGVMLGLLRWTYAPHQHRYLYLAFFLYGICFNNHQSLLVIAFGFEALIMVVQPKLAREMFLWNTLVYLGGLIFGTWGYLNVMTSNTPVFVIFNVVGLSSAAIWSWLSYKLKKPATGILGLIAVVLAVLQLLSQSAEKPSAGLVIAALVWMIGSRLFEGYHAMFVEKIRGSREWLITLACGGSWIVGTAFYLYMPLAGMTNPPMQWGYPRTVEGFFHAFTRGQYEKIHPTGGSGETAVEVVVSFVTTYAKQLWMYLEGLNEEFSLVLLVIAGVIFLFYRRMQARERAWTLGLTVFFFCLGPFLVLLLNPPPDRAARELIRVFFTASHTIVAMGVGYGLTLIAATLATNYEKARQLAILGGLVAVDLALFSLVVGSDSLLGDSSEQALGSLHSFIKFVFVILTLVSGALVTFRLIFRPAESREHSHLLLGAAVIFCVCLFQYVQILIGEVGTIDQPTLTGYTKILCWLLAAICLHYAHQQSQGNERTVMVVATGLLAVLSVGMTLAKMLGDQPQLQGLLSFLGQLQRAFNPGQYALPVFAGMIVLAATIIFTASTFVKRQQAPLGVVLILFAAMPLYSVMSHWFENEQRGHLFGYWFGHDMFTPPFTGKDGKFGSYDPNERAELMKDPQRAKFIYPEMTRDAILYGGTDPGRFCPTYMIFNESFIPPRCKPLDPNFDRRDVYIITQNALADGTYLNYIRAHYNRSTQKDPPFFQELLRSQREREENYSTNLLARLAYTLLDRPFTQLGANIEERRRREGVYPPNEMYIASPDDSSRCFADYMADAQKRIQHDRDFPNEPRQIRPGEDVRIVDNKVQVSGQVAVMTINGLITKVMFDRNPTNEFFVEESFPLEWMYPHLTPFGIIMKINRQTLPTLSEELIQRDHEFWSRFSERLIGNWITYDTSVKEIADFVEKVYLRRDLSGFKGDRKFVRDDQAQKAFSKLRSSIGGVYSWRLSSAALTKEGDFRPKSQEEFQRLYKEADFTFRQAFAFCPYSPEAVFRYVTLLTQPQINRIQDALIVAETCLKLDPYNGQVVGLVNSLRQAAKQSAEMEKVRSNFAKLQEDVRNNPTNYQAAFNLASAYLSVQQTNMAIAVFDRVLGQSNVDPQAVYFIADYYANSQNLPKLEGALEALVKVMPEKAEAWYDLAALRSTVGKNAESLAALARALELSASRLRENPKASNLLLTARTDPRLTLLRQLPEFKKLVPP